MVDVDVVPKIRCDNCGATVEKTHSGTGASRTYTKPSLWGGISAIGGRSTGAYGEKDRLNFTDLCPACATAALNAAAEALKQRRGEETP